MSDLHSVLDAAPSTVIRRVSNLRYSRAALVFARGRQRVGPTDPRETVGSRPEAPDDRDLALTSDPTLAAVPAGLSSTF